LSIGSTLQRHQFSGLIHSAGELLFARAGQRVIVVAGVPLGTPGTTNMLRIAYVGPDSDADM